MSPDVRSPASNSSSSDMAEWVLLVSSLSFVNSPKAPKRVCLIPDEGGVGEKCCMAHGATPVTVKGGAAALVAPSGKGCGRTGGGFTAHGAVPLPGGNFAEGRTLLLLLLLGDLAVGGGMERDES